MKNKLADLNNHLFAQLERLSEEKMTTEQLSLEIDRTKAITLMSREIISNGRLVLDAVHEVSEGNIRTEDFPKMLGIDLLNTASASGRKQ